MHPKDADRIANSIDSDQTALSDQGLHCLPRPIYLSEHLGSLRYILLALSCAVSDPSNLYAQPLSIQ